MSETDCLFCKILAGTAAADVVSFLFIISTIWTVKGQFHEAGEGDDAAAAYLFCNDFREIFQLLVEWCGFSYYTAQTVEILWQK